jgi:thiol-disulfide isomerase/thioredoxin/ribosomal protein L40E
MAAPPAESQFSSGASQRYVVQQQHPGTHDSKLVYICPRCGARADPRTGSCYNCGYIGSLAYEMPKQQPPGEMPPPPAPARSFVRSQGSTTQQYSHPPEPTRACPSCGAPLSPDSRFCRQCGFRSSGSSHQAATPGTITGAVEKMRNNPPPPSSYAAAPPPAPQRPSPGMSPVTPVMRQTAPSMQPMPAMQQAMPSTQAMPPSDGFIQDLMGPYTQGAEMPYPGMEQPEKKGKRKEKRERPYPQEKKGFPMGLLIAVFVVAAALVAMIMFTVSQILAPAPPTTAPTIDKTPPAISDVEVSSVTASSITIEWITNEKGTSQIMICDPAGVCTYTEPSANLLTDHVMVLDIKKLNLKLGTEYHLTVKSIDAAGNEGSYETDQTFTVGMQPPPTIPEGLEVGKRAFNFTLKNLQDTDVSLKSQLGKKVMVNFWAVTCGPCVAELPYIEEVYKAHSPNLAVLAINEDTNTPPGTSKTMSQSFISSGNYTFTVLLDTEANVRSLYNVTAWPVTFFIDTTGVIRNVKVGTFANKAEIETILNAMQ